jgi:hypothetical protein
VALWGTGIWDTAKWTEQVGLMAATETGVDVFAAEGDVVVAGTMAATESTTDTFASTGTVEAVGTMAAVESGVDVFAAEGDVEVVGLMAATESTTDTFSGEGDVNIAGTMAATETGVDTFSADGDVEIVGSMAAVETGEDVFAAEGDVVAAGVMAAVETGEDVFAATGSVSPAPPPIIADVGADDGKRKKAQKKRDEAFEREKQERQKLREQIEAIVDPLKAKALPVVVSEGTKTVQLLSVDGSRVGVNVPPAFDPAEVVQIISQVLQEAQIAAQQVKDRVEAQRALAMAQAEVARIIRRRKQDELLLLLD